MTREELKKLMRDKDGPLGLSALEPIAYQLDYDERASINVQLQLRRGMNGVNRWAISDTGCVLNRLGEWEDEPLPSSRDDAYFKRCRFDSAEEALAFWRAGNYRSRFEHYRMNNL